MGHNIDLQWLLDLPEKVRCPNCNNLTGHYFEEYDIDCGSPETKNGFLTLDCCCHVCEKDFDYEIKYPYLVLRFRRILNESRSINISIK